MVVILVQTTNADLLFAALQLPVEVAVFSAGAGLQGQSAVGPQLSLGTKTMRRLDQSHGQGRADGSEGGNLPELGRDEMFPTLAQQFAPSFPAQILEHVHLLVKSLASPAYARLRDLAQPLGAMTGSGSFFEGDEQAATSSPIYFSVFIEGAPFVGNDVAITTYSKRGALL